MVVVGLRGVRWSPLIDEVFNAVFQRFETIPNVFQEFLQGISR